MVYCIGTILRVWRFCDPHTAENVMGIETKIVMKLILRQI